MLRSSTSRLQVILFPAIIVQVSIYSLFHFSATCSRFQLSLIQERLSIPTSTALLDILQFRKQSRESSGLHPRTYLTGHHQPQPLNNHGSTQRRRIGQPRPRTIKTSRSRLRRRDVWYRRVHPPRTSPRPWQDRQRAPRVPRWTKRSIREKHHR